MTIKSQEQTWSSKRVSKFSFPFYPSTVILTFGQNPRDSILNDLPRRISARDILTRGYLVVKDPDHVLDFDLLFGR